MTSKETGDGLEYFIFEWNPKGKTVGEVLMVDHKRYSEIAVFVTTFMKDKESMSLRELLDALPEDYTNKERIYAIMITVTLDFHGKECDACRKSTSSLLAPFTMSS